MVASKKEGLMQSNIFSGRKVKMNRHAIEGFPMQASILKGKEHTYSKHHGIQIVCAVVLLVTSSFADNPVVQTCYTADPAPMVYNGRVYMYVGHDSDGASGGYVMRNWKCYSSADMVNWTDHGVMLHSSSISWSTAHDANAAQVVFRNGKFYYYISITASDGMVAIGVAVSNSPTGPFKDTLGKALIAGSQMTGCSATHGWRGLDPTVWIDTSGQAYLYWGNNVFYWVRLNADMISTSGSISCLAQNDPAFGPDYEEGPWVYKRNSIYYLVYPSGFPEVICYTTSSGPTGSWSYKSQIMARNGCSTIHPGVCDFNGNSYFFYHNAVLPGGGDYKRSVCIERFTYNGDGTIPTINGTTGGVVTGVGNLNPYDTTQAETICWESGIKTEVCSEGGIDVDSIHNGDYIKVEGVNFGSGGASSFIARVASATSGGNIELRLDTTTGTLVGTCSVAGTSGWQTWATRTCTVTGATGIHNLFLRFTGNAGLLFNFNWWKFNQTVGTVPGMGAKGERWNPIKVATGEGYIKLDFSQPITQGKLNVSLFDVSGHLLTTLFTGRLSTSHLILPLNREEIRPGAYLIRIKLDNNILIANGLIFNN
jgi:arabinoxylan arabinofuranohydrolase